MDRNILKTISTIEELNIEELNEYNLGIEIQDFTEPNLSPHEIQTIVNGYMKKLKDFQGIKSLHGPFLDLKPSSPDEMIREVSYNRYLNAIKIATRLEMEYIIFHSQINPYLNEPRLKELNNSQSKEFWEKILEEVSDYKGIILLENIFEETPQMIKELIETIGLPNIKINLDVGHAKLGKVSLEEWIKGLKDHIAYIHIHSNNGLYDQHQKPSGEEIERLYSLLDQYQINPVVSLEYKIRDLKEEISRYR